MKKITSLFIFMLLFITVFFVAQHETWLSLFIQRMEDKPLPSFRSTGILQEIPKKIVGQKTYYSLYDLMHLGVVKGKVDSIQETCVVERGAHHYRLESSISVLLHNGIYEPIATPILFQNKTCYLPEEVSKKVIADSKQFVDQPKQILSFSAKQLATYLSFLRSPIPGAHVSTLDSSLPGAVRAYRHGIHEGLDWYTFGTGKTIDTHTPVLSMGTGMVVRSDQHYHEMKPAQRNRMLTKGAKNNGQTPVSILDKLRGRTVWIQYDNGVMARYCHLSKIPQNIRVGTHVKAGDIVGYVGNSGTSDGALKNKQGLHLHLDILVYGQWIWGKYTLVERRMILESVFNK
jgi:murein DD-endopeptidase MepM/ murein hydrolase activator NlpD